MPKTTNHDKTTLPGALHPEVIKWLSDQGAKGGKIGGIAKSPAKTAAARANAKKPRRKSTAAAISELKRQNALFRAETRICSDCDGVRKAEYDHARELLRRWVDWARAHGHDVGMLDDTRAFLPLTQR